MNNLHILWRSTGIFFFSRFFFAVLYRCWCCFCVAVDGNSFFFIFIYQRLIQYTWRVGPGILLRWLIAGKLKIGQLTLDNIFFFLLFLRLNSSLLPLFLSYEKLPMGSKFKGMTKGFKQCAADDDKTRVVRVKNMSYRCDNESVHLVVVMMLWYKWSGPSNWTFVSE